MIWASTIRQRLTGPLRALPHQRTFRLTNRKSRSVLHRAAQRFLGGKRRQPACKPGSVGPEARLRTWRPFLWDGRCRPPLATNPDDSLETGLAPVRRRVVPIRFCSWWGLPCRPRCRVRGALLPHPFTLTSGRNPEAVCFLWHCPWGHPRRTLSGTVLPWSPDFPLRVETRSGRPAG